MRTTLPAFELYRPTTVESVSELLLEHGDDAAVLAGGTELILLMKLGFSEPGHVVDVKGVDELGGIKQADAELVIGGTVSHREVEHSSLVAEHMPELARMERRVANQRVRNSGTLGGNLCFLDPHSDPATFLLALDASVRLRSGRDGSRTLPLAEFMIGPYQTALEPGELLSEIRIPIRSAKTRVRHAKIAFRERPAVTATVVLDVDDVGVSSARVVVGAAGPVASRCRAAEDILRGAGLCDTDNAVALAGQAAAEEANVTEDANGAADYKRHLAGVLVRRALEDALAVGAADL